MPAGAGDGVERLGPAGLEQVRTLYADGESAGEAPDFFFPGMLGQVFFGLREHGELVTVAGTHLVAPGESVATVGNVYTRRDRRGRGLAARWPRASPAPWSARCSRPVFEPSA